MAQNVTFSTTNLNTPPNPNPTQPATIIDVTTLNPVPAPGSTLTFQLIVEDNSTPPQTATATKDVVIVGKPTADIEVAPASPQQAQQFTLDGSKSSEPGGQIVKYTWTLTKVTPPKTGN